MVPEDYAGFFTAMAGAAAALVGLLFVAISVAPHRLVQRETRLEAETLANFALSCFTDVLLICTIALIPGVNIGWPAAIIGFLGFLAIASRGRLLWDERRQDYAKPSWWLLVFGQALVFGWQGAAGVGLIIEPRDATPLDMISGLLVAALSIGIGRSWRLVGMRSSSVASSVTTLLRGGDFAGQDPVGTAGAGTPAPGPPAARAGEPAAEPTAERD